MNKSIFPNLFTAANLAFGIIGITLTAQGHYMGAAICVILSLVADGFDGRVARALGVSGPFGRELDSLADVVGFGVSPAYMLYHMNLQDLGWIGYIPLLAFAVLGAFRLARFNIMTEEVHGYFQGLPIPAAGCMAATYVLSGVHIPQTALAILMIIVGYLMVSQVHHPDFKGKGADKTQPIALIVVAILAIVALIWDWHSWPVLIFALYAVFGIVNTLCNRVVRKAA